MTEAPREAFEQEIHGARTLGLWGGLTGIAVALSCTLPLIATIVMVEWGDDLSGPSDGSMFHGFEVFAGWLLTSLLGGVLICVLAITALTLDILMLVRLDRLRTLRAVHVAPLGWSLLVGSGLISTPILGALHFVPVTIFGPGPATRVSLLLLSMLLVTVPILGRVAEIITARQVAPPESPGAQSSPLAPRPLGPATP